MAWEYVLQTRGGKADQNTALVPHRGMYAFVQGCSFCNILNIWWIY